MKTVKQIKKEARERFRNEFVDTNPNSTDYNKPWFREDAFIKTPAEIWRWIDQLIDTTIKQRKEGK